MGWHSRSFPARLRALPPATGDRARRHRRRWSATHVRRPAVQHCAPGSVQCRLRARRAARPRVRPARYALRVHGRVALRVAFGRGPNTRSGSHLRTPPQLPALPAMCPMHARPGRTTAGRRPTRIHAAKLGDLARRSMVRMARSWLAKVWVSRRYCVRDCCRWPSHAIVHLPCTLRRRTLAPAPCHYALKLGV